MYAYCVSYYDNVYAYYNTTIHLNISKVTYIYVTCKTANDISLNELCNEKLYVLWTNFHRVYANFYHDLLHALYSWNGPHWTTLVLIAYASKEDSGEPAHPHSLARTYAARSLIQAVSQEEHSNRKPDPWPLWMAGHAQLKFVMTGCSKTQTRLTRPRWLFVE